MINSAFLERVLLALQGHGTAGEKAEVVKEVQDVLISVRSMEETPVTSEESAPAEDVDLDSPEDETEPTESEQDTQRNKRSRKN